MSPMPAWRPTISASRRSSNRSASINSASACAICSTNRVEASGDARFLHQLIGDGVGQGLEGGVDEIPRDADRGPALAAPVAELDEHARHGVRAALEDAHLIVEELEILDQ